MFSFLQSPTSSTLHWLLVLYHQTSKRLLSNPCSETLLSTKMYWKTTIQSQTYHFCQKFLKRLFYTDSLHASKKTTPAILSSQPTTPDTALRPHSSLVNDLLNTTDKDKISVLLLLDLSAAFDTIDHQIFLSCLETAFGIHSIAVQWFRSYLLDRNQCVVVNNSASSSSPLMFGVPQGSVLDLCCLFCTLLHFQTS